MLSLVLCFFVMFLLGVAVVVLSPSPYFSALGLVFVAVSGCFIVLYHGGTFLSLVLVLLYLGGMMVVFVYSAALAADPYPEVLGGRVIWFFVICVLCICFAGYMSFNDFFLDVSVACEGADYTGGIFGAEWLGVTTFYEVGLILVLAGWALLVCLFSVLVVVRGVNRGALRAV
ncbi:NADH dehydrogenase subunit 6 (mitochondrion) [Petromyzon marinus]|uniref:NADH-ubiquinone oxidoreductase chain 6 n=6 Tax=Petromyzon marinus TaxID=7757 RepID=NU6M_PETMA|nr:NADH dehydrogenase subunit 6 [Petromyzon marinus]Q35544.1 RecName: Full=NADH-ubiquinone oxidoreductase chain 6; AltName: Full=NADH dehydrogenase subunit 6 [Petromyzon marinus]AAB08749.1 NADH dehydrogenase subunit 6 [Petromyzon marinus]QWE36589.1 NADH dehydrogenase subunit 6 [Petromyzon marinus]